MTLLLRLALGTGARVGELARSGVEIGTAAAVLGHSPKTMLAAYRQVGFDERRAVAEALASVPRGQVIKWAAQAPHKSAHNSGDSTDGA